MKKEADFENRKVLVVGLGKSGRAAIRLLLERGALVSLQDGKADADTFEFAGRLENVWLGEEPPAGVRFDLAVLSPGVPPALPFIERLKERGCEIIGELELAYRAGQGRYIAISGTNGKTTTTTLVGEIFKRAGRKTVVAGNIGIPVCETLGQADGDTWLVTEVSSFQLETVKCFRPEVAAILNITPDHLNRHGDMAGYAAAKARIFENQTKEQYFVYNADDAVTAELAKDCPAISVPFGRKKELAFGAFVKDGKIAIADEKGEISELCGASELRIPGLHNLENALAAAAIAYFAGIEPDVIAEELREFPGVEHRIEPCGELRGVRFVNDSKGTNPDAAIKAIEAIGGNIIIIAGGYDKGSDFDDFTAAFSGRVKYAVLLGKTAEKIAESAKRAGFGSLSFCADMKACVERAFEESEPGDTVLLSPACASWDMYANFEERGRDFKKCVRELSDENAKP